MTGHARLGLYRCVTHIGADSKVADLMPDITAFVDEWAPVAQHADSGLRVKTDGTIVGAAGEYFTMGRVDVARLTLVFALERDNIDAALRETMSVSNRTVEGLIVPGEDARATEIAVNADLIARAKALHELAAQATAVCAVSVLSGHAHIEANVLAEALSIASTRSRQYYEVQQLEEMIDDD